MEKENIDPKILGQIEKLQLKYEAMGQDLSSYLDGLLHANYLNYWDYIHLDTLMSLQTPKTDFPDEVVFIIYHQVTELYFKLITWEIDQLLSQSEPSKEIIVEKISRANRYWKHLVSSFDVMVDGMQRKQFLKFRMSLLPSSGFQSVQYRLIEIKSTDFINLVAKDARDGLQNDATAESLFKHVYWRSGATELATGKKTLTLAKFEKKYKDLLVDTIQESKKQNLLKCCNEVFADSLDDEVKNLLREYDHFANVLWPLSHLKSAVRYLQKDPDVISATGGTNWQKYLPPRHQLVMFFPELWSEEEKKNWGRKTMIEILRKTD